MRQSGVKCEGRAVEERKGGIACPTEEPLIAGGARGVVEGGRICEWEVHGDRGEILVVAAADIVRGTWLLKL